MRINEWALHGTGISTTDVTNNKGTIDSEYPGLNNNERVDRLIDKSSNSKYCTDFISSAWISYQSPVPVKLTAYSITSANDAEERDPKNWILEASNNGSDWTTIDSRKDQLFPYRFVTQYYACNKEEKEYTHFRLNITKNNGASLLQFAEWQLLQIEGAGGREESTKIPETTFGMSIYPNPVLDYLYIDVSENVHIAIYSISGQLKSTQVIQKGISTIRVSDYEKGMYIIKITAGNETISKRMIKQ